jgi:hypothetical protein
MEQRALIVCNDPAAWLLPPDRRVLRIPLKLGVPTLDERVDVGSPKDCPSEDSALSTTRLDVGF